MTLFHSWLNPKLEVRIIRQGYSGVFAKAPVVAEERLAILGGHIMSVENELEFEEGKNDYALQIDEQFVIGTAKSEELENADYFNHCCDPNAGFKGQIFLVAMRKIAAGEEITFDYAMVLHEIAGGAPYRMECYCGSQNCRGIVTDNDWKLPELQKRYDGYFQWYLQDKIEKQESN